mgnify:CR=1 FL=1
MHPSREDFKKFVNENLRPLIETKGLEYAPKEALHNFYEGARFVGTTNDYYLLSLATKHIIALRDAITGDIPATSEKQIERAMDAAVYMLLLALMYKFGEEFSHE